jgi:hypothetical protein
MLCGCGASYAADESTVFVRKDGSVVTTDVEEFDADTYDEADFKSYVEDAISAYNGESGEKTVKLKNLSVKDGKATLTIAYDSAEDYTDFTGISLFSGSVAEALAAGYSFDDDFVKVQNDEFLACSTDEFLNEAGYRVAIIRGDARVQVQGTIAYVTTTNTTYVDGKTIQIAAGTSIYGGESVSESTESATEVVSTEEGTEAQETSGSVSDDDLLNAAGSDDEVVFDFPDDGESATDGAVSQVFTYIIYK